MASGPAIRPPKPRSHTRETVPSRPRPKWDTAFFAAARGLIFPPRPAEYPVCNAGSIDTFRGTVRLLDTTPTKNSHSWEIQKTGTAMGRLCLRRAWDGDFNLERTLPRPRAAVRFSGVRTLPTAGPRRRTP